MIEKRAQMLMDVNPSLSYEDARGMASIYTKTQFVVWGSIGAIVLYFVMRKKRRN